MMTPVTSAMKKWVAFSPKPILNDGSVGLFSLLFATGRLGLGMVGTFTGGRRLLRI